MSLDIFNLKLDEIIQNKQLEDTITERQVLRARKNIGT